MGKNVGANHHSPQRNRRSIRLQGYDYSQAGAYFVSICAHNRACLFGEIADGQMVLNDAGRVAEKCWYDIPIHFPHVALDSFVIMPNHIHGILVITETVGAKYFSPLQPGQRPCGTSKTIGSIIRGFKIGVTKWMHGHTNVHDVWQRNYYEHVIRNEDELDHVREYIINNPKKWEFDRDHPHVM
jgi:REP element-mobilizing transposase RayT